MLLLVESNFIFAAVLKNKAMYSEISLSNNE